MKYQVKELDIGGILDQAIAVLKNRFGLLLGINLVMLVPFQIISNFLTITKMPKLPPHPTAQDLAEIQRQFAGTFLVLLPVMLLFLIVIMPLTNAAITFAVANEYLERPITLGGALRRALGILLPFMGTGILFYLAVWGGMILCIIPGIIFAFWFALWSQVVVVEGVSGTTALKRSKFLMKGNIGKFFIMGLIVAVINAAIGTLASFIPEQHVAIVAGAILQGVLFSFAGAAYVVFYFSCRCKVENFDLTLLANSVAAE